jgi:Ni/Fe-hydrogenase subunit HybB-like protein
MRIVRSLLRAAVGAVLLMVGAAALKWYVWDAVIGQAGEPDRSMLFWGLPILFIGFFAGAAGVGLIIVVVHDVRSHRVRGVGEGS